MAEDLSWAERAWVRSCEQTRLTVTASTAPRLHRGPADLALELAAVIMSIARDAHHARRSVITIMASRGIHGDRGRARSPVARADGPLRSLPWPERTEDRGWVTRGSGPLAAIDGRCGVP